MPYRKDGVFFESGVNNIKAILYVSHLSLILYGITKINENKRRLNQFIRQFDPL